MNDKNKGTVNICFMGLGLIGGTLAKALKKAGAKRYHITAYDRNQASLSLALSEGTVDRAVSDAAQGALDCDFLFLCAPVFCNNELLTALKPVLPSNCILTDVGSVKNPIHGLVKRLGLSSRFIGGHPMAGSEKSGYEHSDPNLIDNAYYILTPAEGVPAGSVERLRELVRSMGAIDFVMTCEEHDYITAAVSHLPHIIAVSLVNLIKDSDNPHQWMRMMAAGGFKDITRIASSSPVMWEQICAENAGNISRLLKAYVESLKDWDSLITDRRSPEINRLFAEAGEYRNSLSDVPHGPIKKLIMLYCDIVNESGSIAAIAAILAQNQISLKNIGIIHNREFDQGVLRMEFYEERAVADAAAILEQHGYTVYRRG